MGDIAHAVNTALWVGIPLLIFWCGIVIAIIISQRIYVKRARKFCMNENTAKTTGVVNNLITRTLGDSYSPNYYAQYLFYDANNMPFTGEYGIEKQTEYKSGLSVTVYYNKFNPAQNICNEEIAYKEKLMHGYYKLILFGTVAMSALTLIVFLSQL